MSPIEIENHLKIPVFLFTLLLFFQMITGLLLFNLHLGWTEESILSFYRLNAAENIQMSFETFLQTASPHLLSMALISFLIIHFLTFAVEIRFSIRWWFAVGLSLFTLLDIFAGLAILYIHPSLYLIKIIAFVGFQFFFLSCTLMMFLSLMSTFQTQSTN